MMDEKLLLYILTVHAWVRVRFQGTLSNATVLEYIYIYIYILIAGLYSGRIAVHRRFLFDTR